MNKQSFGSQLRQLRLEAGLSQEALADRAGLSTASISAYEGNRRRRPYPHTLLALAAALGLTPAQQDAFVAGVSIRCERKPPATPPREAEASAVAPREHKALE